MKTLTLISALLISAAAFADQVPTKTKGSLTHTSVTEVGNSAVFFNPMLVTSTSEQIRIYMHPAAAIGYCVSKGYKTYSYVEYGEKVTTGKLVLIEADGSLYGVIEAKYYTDAFAITNVTCVK